MCWPFHSLWLYSSDTGEMLLEPDSWENHGPQYAVVSGHHVYEIAHCLTGASPRFR